MVTFTLDIRKLINEISVRPAIWDMRSKQYSNKTDRKRAWEEVTLAFAEEKTSEGEKKILGDVLQKKWKNIRDRYSRELTGKTGRSGDGQTQKTSYMYSKQLSFLSDMLQPRATKSVEDSTVAAVRHTENTRAAHESSDGPIHKRRRRKKGSAIEQTLVEAPELHSARHERNEMKETENEDDDKYFLLSLLPYLRTIPPHLKLAARMDIMQTINKYISVQPQETTQREYQYTPNLVSCAPVTDHHQFATIVSQQTETTQQHQPGPSGIQHSSELYLIKQEPQSNAIEVQEHKVRIETPSPVGSVYSPEDSDSSSS